MSARKPFTADDPRHGTPNGYDNLRCRCDRCTAAWRDYIREREHRAGRAVPLDEYRASRSNNHGTYAYKKRGCRCEVCRAAIRDDKRRYRARPGVLARERVAQKQRRTDG